MNLSTSVRVSDTGAVQPGTSYNFPNNASQGLLVICLVPGTDATDTNTVTTSCTKGELLYVAGTRGSIKYKTLIIPVSNVTTSSTFSYTSSKSLGASAWFVY